MNSAYHASKAYNYHISPTGSFPRLIREEIAAVKDFAEHLRDDSWRVEEHDSCPLVAVIVVDLHTKRVSTMLT